MTNKMKFSTYAIDFDDTITQNTKFPEIGELRPHADRVMRRIKESGGEIAIWTCRTGEHEERVKKFLESHNIPYDTFNDILPSERKVWGEGGRKIFTHCYIDDKGIYAQMNGGIDWLQIERYIFGNTLNNAGMITSGTIDTTKITIEMVNNRTV
jgi:hypothetical protein